MAEFDDLFVDTPKKAPAKAKPESASDDAVEESPESKSAKTRTLRQQGTEFEGLFADDSTPPAKTPIDPKLLAATGAGALGGGLYGALKKPVSSENSLAARLMERYHGLPSGALNTFEGALPTPANEASLIAARAIAPPPPTSSPLGPVNPQAELTPEQVARILQGGESDTKGTTGRARQTGYNIQTAQESAIKDLMGLGMTELDARAYLANMPGLTATPSGVIVPRSTAVPTAGPRTQPDVWKRPRATGPVPWTGGGQTPAIESMDVRPSPLGNLGAERPGGGRPAPAAPTPQPQPTIEEIAAKIRAASGRSHAMQRGANVAARGFFGAPLAAQAYNMATQEEPTDWQQWLSLGGNALGTFGPLTSKIPKVAGRMPLAGPLAALAQIPYAVKHREEIARGMTLPDVVSDPSMLTGTEMWEKLPLFNEGNR